MWIWITTLWMVLSVSTVDAQDLLSSKVDPSMLLDGFEPSIQDAEKVEETLLRYAKGSKYVVIGEVLHVDRRISGSVLDREASIEVISWMRGDGDYSISVVMPYNAPYIDTDWSTVPGFWSKDILWWSSF